MCDWHRSQWRNLYHQYLQQHVQMPWSCQQQYPYVSAIASHFPNNGQCHCCSAHIPPSLCANESPCHCCSAPTLPVRTCYIYANKSPYHCCTNHPLPFNTGCTSQSCYYPKRYPVMIEPHVLPGYAYGFKNADKSESSSEDEDDEDSSNEDSFDDSSDENEDDYDDDSSIDIQFSKENANESRIIERRPSKLKEQNTGVDYASMFKTDKLREFVYWNQILVKKREELYEEYRKKEKEGFGFKISEEVCEEIKFDDSDDEDSSDEDEDDDYASDEDTDDDSSNEDDGKDSYDENEDDEYSSDEDQVREKIGRMTPTTLEDNLLEQKLRECVYGAKAEAICGQETQMITKFDRLSDMTLPMLWPVLPISP